MEINTEEFLRLIERRRKEAEARNLQPTLHQQDAIDTAKMLNDFASLGIYMRIFKNNRQDRHLLLACRDWVLKKNDGRIPLGRLFVAAHRRFLGYKKEEK